MDWLKGPETVPPDLLKKDQYNKKKPVLFECVDADSSTFSTLGSEFKDTVDIFSNQSSQKCTISPEKSNE